MPEVNADVHVIQGRPVTMPVRIRHAQVATAMFAVPAATAQEMIDYSGLEVVRPWRGKAICSLAFIDYIDGDLDTYHEFGVSFLVRRHDAGPRPRGLTGGLRDLGAAGAFIHRLPVDQTFTLEAGRSIWGFPKVLGEIPMEMSGRVKRCGLRLDGRLVIEMSVRPGLPIPMPTPKGTSADAGAGAGAGAEEGSGGEPEITAYSCLDGVTRQVPWAMDPSGVRTRPGGATVRLGDHELADELRRLGLDGKRALATSTIPHLRMTFRAATEVPRKP